MYEYKNQKELYNAVEPAINVKLRLLNNAGYVKISKRDIWNCLKDTKWVNGFNLTLADIVNDIIHIDNKDIDIYLRKRNK